MHSLKSLLSGLVDIQPTSSVLPPAPVGSGAIGALSGAPETSQPHAHAATLRMLGQGTVSVDVARFTTRPTEYSIVLDDGNGHAVFRITVRDRSASIALASDWDKQGNGRTHRPGASAAITPFITFQASSMSVWISVDRSNNRVSLGQGYMMKCNEVAWLQLEDRSKGARLPGTASAHTPVWEVQHVVFDSKVAFYDDREPRVNLMPVVVNVAPVVVGRDAITLENIAHSDCVPASELPDASQVLWGTVSGERIRVSDSDAAAINYSLDTPGKTLYEIVDRKRKQSEFGDPHMVYVRVTIGPPLGDSPGSPFVMEIWPVGCYSPVHNHGGTVAVIKVLHGSILSRWYNPLADKDNPEPVSFAEQTFDAGGVTWLTPEMYQTHQLRNPRSDTACVTIQSYRYLGDDDVHYEYFDYVGPKGGELKHFTPDSDITYTELIERVRKEYAEARVTARSVPGTRLHAPR